MVEVPVKDASNSIPLDAILEINANIEYKLKARSSRRAFLFAGGSLAAAGASSLTYLNIDTEKKKEDNITTTSQGNIEAKAALGLATASSIAAFFAAVAIGALRWPIDVVNPSSHHNANYDYENRNILSLRERAKILKKHLPKETTYDSALELLKAYEDRKGQEIAAQKERASRAEAGRRAYKPGKGAVIPSSQGLHDSQPTKEL